MQKIFCEEKIKMRTTKLKSDNKKRVLKIKTKRDNKSPNYDSKCISKIKNYLLHFLKQNFDYTVEKKRKY